MIFRIEVILKKCLKVPICIWNLFVFSIKYHNCRLPTIQQSMKKFFAIMGDVAVVVGCCIGVGFLSGKEAQVFFGNIFNVAIFAAFFFAVSFALREYCRKNGCSTVDELSGSLFGKFAKIFNVGIALCSFVCIVTVLAGVEECLSRLFYLSNLPLYAFAAALFAALLLQRDMKMLKYANMVSIIMAVILVIILLTANTTENSQNLQVPLFQPVIYALFSVTMSLGVITRLACESDRRQNVTACVLASVITAILMAAILPLCKINADLPTLDGISSPALIAYALITLLLAAVTGVVANAYPVVQELKSIVPDNALCNALIFGLALAFSMFGFDFAVKFGYLLVSLFGAVIVVLAICKLCFKRKKPVQQDGLQLDRQIEK